MATIINANEAGKFVDTPLFLQCKTKQDIIIKDVPSFDASSFVEATGYTLEKDGNITATFKRGETMFLVDDKEVSNDLYDLSIIYLAKEKIWKITITVEHEHVNNCKIKNLKLAITVAIPEFIDIKIKFSCQAGKQCIESLLAIDLGNTRSCVLLCEDIKNITRNEGMQIHRVPLFSYTDNKISDIGVFDSFVSFSKISGVSFTRVGREAIPVANTLRGLRGSGDFYLSSPKRYYWDCDENLNGWRALGAKKTSTTLKGITSAECLREFFDSESSNSLPRAAILSSMLIEILEQAETYINSSGFYSVNDLPKVISHVCVTYPAGWSEQERKKYHEVLESAVKIYQSQRCNATAPIVLDVTCDEATAVLLCYIYGEIAKYSGYADSWLGAIGRSSACVSGTHARIAVIDVGGGTSDLAIVNIQNKKSDNGLNLQIDKLYKDGTNKAGDLLLQKVTELILVKKIATGTIGKSAPKDIKDSYITKFSSRLNALSTDARVKQLTRRFWFPLAIDFISAVNNGATTVKVPDSVSLLVEIINEHSEEWTKNNVEGNLSELTIAEADKKALSKIVTTTFRETAKLFGAAIYAFDADIVILSGKTTETKQVAQIFQKYCYLPDNRFIPMWNYMIGDWCSIADAGRISDSKYTTAIGAVIYEVSNQNFPIHSLEATIKTQNAPGLNDGNCLWGVANNGYFFAADAIMKPGVNECWIPFVGRPKLLARRRFAVDASEVSISYELRIKPFKKQLQEWQQLKNNYQGCMSDYFDIFCDCDSLSMAELIIARKNNKPLKSDKIKIHIGIDSTDDTNSAVVIKAVDAMYEDGTAVSKEDILLWPKPKERFLREPINVKLTMQTDSYSRALIIIDEVAGKYADGTLVNKNELEIRIRTSGEDLFWLDSGKI